MVNRKQKGSPSHNPIIHSFFFSLYICRAYFGNVDHFYLFFAMIGGTPVKYASTPPMCETNVQDKLSSTIFSCSAGYSKIQA